MKAILATTLVSALALPAFAESEENGDKKPAKERPDPEVIFKKRDTNSDGFLSKEEFGAKMKDPEVAATKFTKKDADSDGKLSFDEFKPKPRKKDATPDGDKEKKEDKAGEAEAKAK